MRIRFLGCWWDAPRGDFPIRAIVSRLRELRDAEIVNVGDREYILGIAFYEDSIGYGYGVFVVLKDEAFLVLLKDVEDWEAVKEYVKEKFGGQPKALIEVLKNIAFRSPGVVELS